MENEYESLLSEIRENQKALFWQQDQEKQGSKKSFIEAIKGYLFANRLTLKDYSSDELAEKIYNDLAEDSVLTDPLNDIWVEKILVKSWDSVFVSFVNGKSVEIDHFTSPRQAADVVRRLLQKEGLDVNSKAAISGLTKSGDKITAFFPPVVREETGVYCTIMKFHQRTFSKKDYVADDFAAQRELDFLTVSVSHGISVLIVGLPEAGKTTLMEYLLNTVEDAVALESDFREFSTGQSLLLTDADSAASCLAKVISMEPNLIGFNLSYPAQEAGLRGIPVISAICAEAPENGLWLAAEMWREHRKEPIDGATALKLTAKVFRLIVTVRRYVDGKRRIQDISECCFEHDNPVLKKIWKYEAESCVDSGSGPVIRGCHKQTSPCSDDTVRRIRQNGINIDEFSLFEMEDENHA